MRQRQQKPLASFICKQHPGHCDCLNRHQRFNTTTIITITETTKGTRDNLLSDDDNNLEQLSIGDALLVLGSSPREKFHSRGENESKGVQ